MATDKENAASQARSLATTFDDLYQRTRPFVELYFDKGYNSGGSDPIADGDITDTGTTATAISNLVTFFQQIDNLWDNAAVTQADYSVTINAIKNIKPQ